MKNNSSIHQVCEDKMVEDLVADTCEEDELEEGEIRAEKQGLSPEESNMARKRKMVRGNLFEILGPARFQLLITREKSPEKAISYVGSQEDKQGLTKNQKLKLNPPASSSHKAYNISKSKADQDYYFMKDEKAVCSIGEGKSAPNADGPTSTMKRILETNASEEQCSRAKKIGKLMNGPALEQERPREKEKIGVPDLNLPACDMDQDQEDHQFTKVNMNKIMKRSKSSRPKKKEKEKEKIINRGQGLGKGKGQGPSPPPPLPEDTKDRIRAMGGSKVQLVIQKRLYDTDLSLGHNRLSMPLNQLKCKFLTDDEADELNRKNDRNECNSLDLRLIEPCGEKICSNIRLRKWDSKTSSSYVLSNTWSKMATRNGLKTEMIIQVWSFRVNQELCFALVKLPDAAEGGNAGGGGGQGQVGGAGTSRINGDGPLMGSSCASSNDIAKEHEDHEPFAADG